MKSNNMELPAINYQVVTVVTEPYNIITGVLLWQACLETGDKRHINEAQGTHIETIDTKLLAAII